jgi:hypothetical protein
MSIMTTLKRTTVEIVMDDEVKGKRGGHLLNL